MIDWNMIAAIVAIIAIPLSAHRLLISPILNLVRDYVLRILYRKYKCKAITGEDLPDGRLPIILSHTRSSSSSAANGNGSQRVCRSNNAKIIRFFERAWGTSPRLVERPGYLRLERRYLRVDADSLMVAIMLNGGTTASLGRRANEPSFRGPERSTFAVHCGSVSGIFHHRTVDDNNDEHVAGSICGFPLYNAVHPRFHGLSKNDLYAIAQGYPPFYRETFRAKSGVEVGHPVRSIRDTARAGWVVAIAFACDSPTVLYNPRHLTEYEEACRRVLHALQNVLAAAFKDHLTFRPKLDAAVKGVAAMNRHKTGSVLTETIHRTVLGTTKHDEIGVNLNATQIRLILNLFNDYSKDALTEDERSELERSLPEALQAALVGVYTWWQYVNNEGCGIPQWLLDERIRRCPIWIEDHEESLQP